MADFSFSNGLNKSLDHQVRDLRKQLSHISKTLADHGVDFEDIADDAGDLVRGARKNAKRAAKHARREADVLTHAVQKAPAAASTVLVVAAAVGFGLGLLYNLVERD